MKYGKNFFRFIILFLFFSGLFIGCKSHENNHPSNPFALSRQTAPPPATFSHQAAYLGQMPSAYVPQLPAATYPSGNNNSNLNSIPTNTPLPNGTTPNGTGTISPSTAPAAPTTTVPNGNYGSISNSGGATLFQTSATIPTTTTTTTTSATSPTTENGWTVSETLTSDNSPAIAATGETAFQNLESKSHSVTTVNTAGIVTTSISEPETWTVSSSPQMTQIVDDSPVPQPVTAEPKSVYAGKYQ
ncbi:MAG: hypothetical protein LBP87_13670 [Planctomycetaceae bacterium]|jgi:chitinase|nr:hypothetical protein [Planctomycetaceae bacterium]